MRNRRTTPAPEGGSCGGSRPPGKDSGASRPGIPWRDAGRSSRCPASAARTSRHDLTCGPTGSQPAAGRCARGRASPGSAAQLSDGPSRDAYTWRPPCSGGWRVSHCGLAMESTAWRFRYLSAPASATSARRASAGPERDEGPVRSHLHRVGAQITRGRRGAPRSACGPAQAAVQRQHQPAGRLVVDPDDAGHDPGRAQRHQGAGEAEQLVSAGRGEQAGVAAGQDQAVGRAAQPLEVVARSAAHRPCAARRTAGCRRGRCRARRCARAPRRRSLEHPPRRRAVREHDGAVAASRPSTVASAVLRGQRAAPLGRQHGARCARTRPGRGPDLVAVGGRLSARAARRGRRARH